MRTPRLCHHLRLSSAAMTQIKLRRHLRGQRTWIPPNRLQKESTSLTLSLMKPVPLVCNQRNGGHRKVLYQISMASDIYQTRHGMPVKQKNTSNMSSNATQLSRRTGGQHSKWHRDLSANFRILESIIMKLVLPRN
jgi:hypothetical protein